ncbi:MAG: hypothetical protein ABH877_05915, partial [bacterium]
MHSDADKDAALEFHSNLDSVWSRVVCANPGIEPWHQTWIALQLLGQMPGEAAAAVVREFKETRSYIFGRVLDVPQGE